MKMKNWVLAALLGILTGTTGCSICCGPYDYDYPTFGGLKQRVDRRHGRVGSVFSDPSITHAYSEVAVSNQPASGTMTPVDPSEKSALETSADQVPNIQPLIRPQN